MIVRPYYLDLLKTYRDVPLVKILAGCLLYTSDAADEL